MPAPEIVLLVVAVLLLVSILASKLGGRLGLPGLLVFLVIGMLAGSDGPGGIWFDNYALAQFVGTVALVFILYTGGLSTRWQTVRPILWPGLSLATLGVLLTMLLTGAFAKWVLGWGWLEALLLGAVVSSTDASAVFSVLRERSVALKRRVRPLLEFESGINDPMAVFLTVGLTLLLTQPERPLWSIVPFFLQQMVLGLALGYAFGLGTVWLIRRLHLSSAGLYAVLSITLMLLGFSATAVLGGSGFLAVYVMGVVVAGSDFMQKAPLVSFHEGITYLMEIGMFLTLGLLVFPSQLPPIAGAALLISLFLMLLGRPLSVFLSMALTPMPLADKALVSWVGLRGAIPIILATFPLLAGVRVAQDIFNITFFIVLTSVLLQGTTLAVVARWLGVSVEERGREAALGGRGQAGEQGTD